MDGPLPHKGRILLTYSNGTTAWSDEYAMKSVAMQKPTNRVPIGHGKALYQMSTSNNPPPKDIMEAFELLPAMGSLTVKIGRVAVAKLALQKVTSPDAIHSDHRTYYLYQWKFCHLV